jgi:hypothetical protein
MITAFINGGLGNQLFQIFCVISYAYENNNYFGFLKQNFLFSSNQIRFSYWNSFLIELQKYLYDNETYIKINKKSPFNIFVENGFEYNKIPLIENENIKIEGYYQSYKYFENYKDKIFDLINLKNKQLIIKNNFCDFDFDNCISIHFRLGDYKNFPTIHPITTFKYYLNSLKYILEKRYSNNNNKKINILYFHENIYNEDIVNVNNIINNLMNNLNDFNFNFFEVPNYLKDWEQVLLMSLCHDNIIPNSTFSWWGAYFNNYEDKIVTYPDTWFGIDCNHNTKDICPPSWECIKC